MNSSAENEFLPPARVFDRYAELQQAMAVCLRKSVETSPVQFGELHQVDADLGLWTDLVADGHNDQLSVARRELALATHCAASIDTHSPG